MRALKGGLLSRVTIHAIDRKGDYKVVAVNGSHDNRYWIWEGQGAANLRAAEPIAISDGQSRPTTTTRYTTSRR
jgi:L-asparaginase / beta-aspartyl-peptidase